MQPFYKMKWTSPLIVVVAAFALLISCNKKSTGPEGPTRPAAPSELTVEASDTSTVMLSWRDNAGNEDGFRVYEWDGIQWTLKGTTAADSTHYLVTGLWPGTEYGFHVSAFNSVGESDFSTPVTISTTGVPSAPQNVTAQTLAHNRIKLAWTDVSDDELGFVVQRHTVTDTFVTIATTAPNDTIYNDDNLTPETLYYYRVGALGPMSTRWSSEDTARTWPYAVPAAPSDLRIEVVLGSRISLAWTDNSDYDLSILIHRKEDGAGYEPLDSIAAEDTTYSDRTVIEYHRYRYQIYAVNEVGHSEGSNEASAYYGPSSAGAIPLARDNSWHYEVHEGLWNYELRTRVLRVDFLGSNAWFLIEEVSGATGEVDTTTYLRNVEMFGVFYQEYGSSETYLLWRYPALVGNYYFVEGDCVRVAATADTLSIPAGRFDNCYRYERFLVNGQTIETVIKPHVGVLRVRRHRYPEIFFDQVLVRYTIVGP